MAKRRAPVHILPSINIVGRLGFGRVVLTTVAVYAIIYSIMFPFENRPRVMSCVPVAAI
jgi:hypothetical protein